MSSEGKSPSVEAATLAKLFNLTSVRITQLAKDGVVIRTARGRYDLWQSIRNYVKFLQERKVNQWDNADKSEDGGYQQHRARLTKAKADVAEMQAAIMKGTVHESGSVEAVWTDMLMSARARLLAIPRGQATLLSEEENANKVEEILTIQIHDALTELSEYDPSIITEKYIQQNQQTLEPSGESEDV